MNTAAVQQSSQMVEIPGAPATVQSAGEDFRATFAASVGGAAAQKTNRDDGSGVAVVQAALSSSKQIAEVVRQSTLLAVNGAKRSVLPSRVDEQDEITPGATLNKASSLSSKAGPTAILKGTVTADASVEPSSLATDSRPAERARLAEAGSVGGPGNGASLLPIAEAAIAPVESSIKPVAGKSGSTADSEVARSRKDELFDLNKAVAPATVQTGVPGSFEVTPIAVPVVLSAEGQHDPVSDGFSLAKPSSKAATSTDLLQANVASSMASGGAARPIRESDLASTTAGFAQTASLRSDGLGIYGTSMGESGTDNRIKIESVSEPGPKSSEAVARPRQSAVQDGSSQKSSLTGASGKISVSPDAPLASLPQASLQPLTPVVATTPKAVAQPHSGVLAQLSGVSQSTRSTFLRSAPDPSADVRSKDPVSAVKPADVDSVPPKSEPPAVQAAANVAETEGAAAAAAAAAVSAPVSKIPEVASRAPVADVKDAKTKAVGTASQDAPAVGSAIAQPSDGDPSRGISSIGFVPANDLSARVTTGAEAVIPAAVATTHGAGSSVHAGSVTAEQAGSARGLASLNAASLQESTGTVAHVVEAHRTLMATPTSLEVGVQSGTQGWLRIRAEVGDQGQVNASLAVGSSGARELLHSQMPALNAFLHSEQISVTTAVVDHGSLLRGESQTTGTGSGGPGSQSGASDSNGSLPQGGGAQGDGGQGGSSSRAASVSLADAARSYNARSDVGEVEGSAVVRATLSDESGRWLNVRV